MNSLNVDADSKIQADTPPERSQISDPAPRVAQVYGFWAQNIGNAFFNIGGRWILEQVFGDSNVGLIRDQPGYRTFYDQYRGNPPNDVNLLNIVDADFVVLQGPMMTSSFRALWEPAFREYRDHGVKVILLGAAFFKYTKEEQEAVKSFLEEYPPAIICTRDQVSYSIIKDWVEWTHSGVDSGFFVTDAYKPLKLREGPYIALNFDRYPEPTITLEETSNSSPTSNTNVAENSVIFEWDNQRWILQIPGVPDFFSRKGKAAAYLGHLLDRRKLPVTLNGCTVIRPEHRYAPHMTWKIYKDANAMTSDEPYSFLTIYANAKLTLADRVHACVATLAYGNPAMLFTPSPRQALFSRLGLDAIRERPVTIDMAYLEEQKQEEMVFLKNAVAAQS